MPREPWTTPVTAWAGAGRAVALVTTAVVLAGTAGCGTVALLTRPDGDGGWSADRRARELGRIAAAAEVDLDPARASAAPDPDGGSATAVDDAGATPVPTLDLAAALTRAARGNRRLEEARQQLAIARARVAEARGALWPATTGSGRYTWYTEAQTAAIALPGAPGAVRPQVEIRDRELGVVGGKVAVPLDLSGEIRHALRAVQAGYRGEAARLWAATLEQELVVIGAYYTLLEAERLLEVTDQTIAVHRQQLGYARDRFAAGRLTKNEVLVVDVALRNAEQRRLQRALARDQARWALNEAVGLPVDAPTTVVDVRERPTLPSEAEARRLAYAQNPALAALLEEQQRLEATATALARGRLPRLSGGASGEDTNSDIIAPTVMGAGFVGFEWDLGTDGRREARIAEARIAAHQNRVRIERELRELERAVRATHRATGERLAALAAAEIAVGQAEENLRIRREQFDAGRATSDDVLDAEALLAGERATLAGALYQAHTRRAELQRLMGAPLGALAGESR